MKLNMSYRAIVLLILVVFVGCIPPQPAPAVTLETPADSSIVPSLTPMLAWSCTGTASSYHLQVATDSNFQGIVIDVTRLTELSYAVPSGNLVYDQTYYWRVSASRDSQTSGWSPFWSFKTRATVGGVAVNALVDGSPWSGTVNYGISGQKAFSGFSVPQTFGESPAGTYTLTYNYGGPPGATLVSITPSPTQTVSSGGAVTFTLNFHKDLAGTIIVNAVMDGVAWSGPVNYTITGPIVDSSSSVSQGFSNQPAGTYTLTYNYGGPTGATLISITPSPVQPLATGGAITFTLNFHRQQVAGVVMVNATLDGAPWRTAIGSGPINYSITGSKSDASSTMPDTFANCPPGLYTLVYNSGGPIGATLASITPSPSQNLPSGGTIVFTMNFYGQAKGIVTVVAAIDGEPWSGSVSYTVVGPYVDSSYSVPETFSNCPQGIYTVSYTSGGPPSTVLDGITPVPTQSLPPGGSLTFTLNFRFVGVPEPPLLGE